MTEHESFHTRMTSPVWTSYWRMIAGGLLAIIAWFTINWVNTNANNFIDLKKSIQDTNDHLTALIAQNVDVNNQQQIAIATQNTILQFLAQQVQQNTEELRNETITGVPSDLLQGH